MLNNNAALTILSSKTLHKAQIVMMNRRMFLWVASICLTIGSNAGTAKGDTTPYASLSADSVAVPQNLLSLIHTEEVQKELGFSEDQLQDLEASMRKIDRVWWPSRNLPTTKARAVVADLELQAVAEVGRILGDAAVVRLRQIELQSQSVRIFARPEVIAYLKLTPAQAKKIGDLFAETDKLAAELSKAGQEPDKEKQKEFSAAKKGESTQSVSTLNKVQNQLLQKLLGKPFEVSSLERLYPFAPELIDSGYWTSDQQATLESLKGQVVLVHFYAYQCHNCVANFEIYKRWDATLKEKGVKVIGIQTPETASERDPAKVTAAAAKSGFLFPVLIDTENKNWDAWSNTMWPTVYVIDKKGYVRFWWQGELNWKGATGDAKIESIVENLLKE
jgi:peroxiredoxin